MHNAALFVLPISSLVVTGCTATEAPPDEKSQPIIGHLRTRDDIVTIHSTGEGLRFTIHTATGELLGESLTVDDLEASYPGVYSLYRSSVAGQGPLIDASLWPNESATGGPSRPVSPGDAPLIDSCQE